MESPDRQAALVAWPRFVLWVAVGVAVGLVTVVFMTLALWLPLVVGVIAAVRRGGRTALGGLLVGLAATLAYVGTWVGAVDRACTSGSIDSNGVETCTQWVPAGSIRWPWFVAAGVLLVVGIALHGWARRSARRGSQEQELAEQYRLSAG